MSAVLGVTPPAEASLPEDGDFGGFRTTAGQLLNLDSTEKYVDAAATLADAVLANRETALPCGADEESCIASFVTSTGAKLFRRPLSASEEQHYRGLFTTTRASATFDDAARVVIQSLVLAPQFMFHVEARPIGVLEGTLYELDGFQLAARLSYSIWQSPPDQELSSLAATGALKDDETLRAQATRLLADDRARPVVRSFLGQWLKLEDIDKIMVDPNKEPEYTPALLAALEQESSSFAENAFWAAGDTLRALLVSETRYRSTLLSDFYGDTLGTQDALAAVQSPVDPKSFGLLSQAGFLAAISRNASADIIYRGRFVRDKLLCGQLHLPPPGIASPLPDVKPDMTARERIEEHTSGAACAGCHRLMNPIGYALEHFDYLGRWRDTDAGRPIDAQATIDDTIGSVNGALELSQRLAESDLVAECAARHVFEFTLGRSPEQEECAFRELTQQNPRDLRALLASIPNSKAFRQRVEPAL